ncbi:MAG: hypothetical protein KAX64_06875 [Chromatiaceae bacterium]|jgi:hypothetical protein|nr:hypothetical protein [Chromatiaceae bacterium]
MDSASIELPGSELEAILLEDDCLRISFSRVIIIKTMTGSRERTRWWQTADLVMEGAEVEGDPPAGPLVCVGGDIDDNIFTYRDMIPLPLSSRGSVGCDLSFRDTPAHLKVMATAIRMEIKGLPKYIEHLRAA